MGRLKSDGKGRLGGRGKGTPNKITSDLKEWIACTKDGVLYQIVRVIL